MREKDIDFFFKTLDEELRHSADVILTGAAAGSILGNIRPSVDIDFQMKLRGAPSQNVSFFPDDAVKRASERTGIAVNFSDSIDRWSMIGLLDYEKHALPYKTIGHLTIKVLSPDYWTIGKMGRFYEIDIQDMIAIIKKHQLSTARLTGLWARILRASGPSLSRKEFYEHVIYFFKEHGHRIWGKGFDAEEAVKAFEKAVHIG